MVTSRRALIQSLLPLPLVPHLDHAAHGVLAGLSSAGQIGAPAGPTDWRRHFPALAQTVNGHQFAYLDTAATAQRPEAVINAVTAFYRMDNANPGRTLHAVARRAYEAYEGARRTFARFIGAGDPLEVIFTRGTT